MPLINFQKRFAEAVATLQKRQTCRAMRKRPIRQGDTLFLYTGCRTPDAHRLLPPMICTSAVPLRIHLHSIQPKLDRLVVNGQLVAGREARDQFAVADGFADWLAMREWLRETHGTASAFMGQLIEW